jgi:formylglycine-generating enzyme required for sulfatase activity/CRP-like cAMP-binding protein
MRAAKKSVENIKILQDLVPLNALSDARFGEISEKIVIEVVKSGRYLFRNGDRDNRSVYLLEGKISLVDGNRKVIGEVVAGTDASRHPIANQQPRRLSARVVEKAVIAYVDSRLLDAYLAWDQSNAAEAVVFDVEDTGDWMSRLLKSETFRKLPPSKLQGLLMKMKPFPVERGDVVISQGEEGDYFYTIHEGRCRVSRCRQDGTEEVLAELGEGDSFGEEALVSDARRNATISMLTDGQLMRLAKEDFDELLKTQLVKYIDYEAAARMAIEGAVWLDVRTPDEYESGAIEDSVNLPLASLRGEFPELVFNSSYIVCCDTGRRSDSAAFILSHKGFDVYVLEGGMSSLPLDGQVMDEGGGEPDTAASDNQQADDAGGMATAEQLAVELRTEKTTLLEENAALAAALEDQRSSVARMNGQIEQLRGELGESAEKFGELRTSKGEQEEEKRQQQAQITALREEQDAQLGALRQALAAEQQKNAALQEQAAAVTANLQAQEGRSDRDVQALASEKQQLLGDMAVVQGRVVALENDLRSAADSHVSRQAEADAAMQLLRDENKQLAEQVSTLEAEHAQRHAELDAAALAVEGEGPESDEQVCALNESLRQLGEELAAANETVGNLQNENRILLEGREKVAARLEEQSGKQQHSDEQQQQLQARHNAERDELLEKIASEQQVSAELREQLEKVRQEMQAQAEQQSKKLLVQADAQKNELAELQQAQTDREAGRLQIEQERDELQRQLASVTDEKQQLIDATASLEVQVESLKSSTDDKLAELQAQLELERQQHSVAQQQLCDKERQIEALEQSLAAGDEARQALDEETGLVQQQLDEAREALQQREEHTRILSQEYAESLSRSHDELTRKNDTEKELQGQIDRLRKKLEQVSLDNQHSRESSLDDLDTLREELHHERQARAEERAQMAARQRELKEQLAAIGTQHEANMTDQSGAIELAREEERSRLQNVLDSQVESEEQLARVQAELQQAHEEIAVLDQQEKARRQAEIDAIEEQKEQAEAAITQLENQLKQLTRERDGALDDQHELRVKMNALRGEVEVARGLMTAGGKGRLEDPEQLRTELEETRKNVKIAVRLRAEAEAAREKMAAEVQRMRAQSAGETDNREPLHVPSLDSFDPAMGQMQAQRPAPAFIPESVVATGRAMGREENRQRGKHRGLKAGIGLLLLAAVGLAAWQMTGVNKPFPATLDDMVTAPGDSGVPLTTEPPQLPVTQASETGNELRATTTKRPVEMPGVVATDVVDNPPAGDSDAVEMATGFMPPPVEKAVSERRPEFVGTQPLREARDSAAFMLSDDIEAVLPGPAVETGTAGSPPVSRSFRDVLKGGGKGPAMVELNAASFLMGSIGNSLNFDESPRHTVKLPTFSISKREVSFAEYDRFARASGRRLPYDETWGRGKHPVINVSWHDAVAYTRWLSKQTGKQYRLPSEAEWEYAARAGSKYSYWWADINSNNHANCFDCGSEWDGKQTAPVGSFPANKFGLFDMSGNVQEWTADCYNGSYAGAPADGSAWVSANCVQRVVRGGAYSSPLDSLRSAKRAQLSQDTRLDNLGFRVVRAD